LIFTVAAPKGNKYGAANKGREGARPITQMLISALNELIREIDENGKPTKVMATRMGLMVRKLCDLALAGDRTAISEIFDRVEGKPLQAVVTADAASEAGKRMMQLPENYKDLPVSELTRLYRESIAASAGDLPQPTHAEHRT
jgi:hypothetical protein